MSPLHSSNESKPKIDVQQVSETYFARIHRAALVLTGSPWDADDLAQETFLVFTRQIHAFAGRSSVYTYLYGILLNLERRHRRRNSLWRRKLRVLWGNQPSQPPTELPADHPAEVREWNRSLWSEVAKLPDGQRQSLMLRFSEHLSYEEIASVLGCPLGTVKSRIHHGLASLRERISALSDDERKLIPGDLLAQDSTAIKGRGEDIANAV